MATYIGRLTDIGLGVESSRGAGIAPTFWLPKTGFSFDDKTTIARAEAGLGKLADSHDSFVISNYGEGDIEAYLGDRSIGYFLYSLLGSVNTSGPTDNAYTHAFSISEANNHQSLAVVVKDANTTEMYRLAMVNSLEISATLEDIVGVTANIMSKQAVSSSATASYTTSDVNFTKSDIQVKVADTVGNLSGASVLSVKELTLSIEGNVTADDSLATAEPEDFFNQQLSVEGELVLNYTDETWKNYMRNETHRAMEIKFVNEAEVIGGGSTNPSLTIQMPKVDFYEWEADYSLDEIVTQTVSFKANYDMANALNVISTCSLVNGQTSY